MGKIDVLKVGHHCYEESSSEYWLKKLDPEIAVICNYYKCADKKVLKRIIDTANPEVYFTADIGGIIIDMDSLKIKDNIM